MPSVFVSYSRRDKEFVQRLHEALTARGYDVWVDWEDIPASAQWMEEIHAGILGADGVIFVISPDSAASEVCRREIEHAAEQHKRVVPVVHRDPGAASVPEFAGALNWVFLREGDDFAAGIETLIGALETDLDHVRIHTQLGVESERWQTSGRERSRLLRGAELSTAEAWLVGAGEREPPPTQLQREYLLTGRQAATRRQRAMIAGVSFGLAVAVVLGVLALIQRNLAIQQRDIRAAEFLDAAGQSNYASDSELSVLLAVQAARIKPDSTTEESLREALAQDHLRRRFSFPAATGAPDAVWSPDGTRLLVTSPGLSASIYRPGTSAPAIALPAPAAAGQAVWDASGNRILIGGAHPAVYDAATGRLIARIPGIALDVALSSDGTRAATTDLDAAGHVFDVATGKLLSSFLPKYRGGVTCFAWAPNGSVIAQCDIKSSTLGDAPGSLDLWNASTGKLLRSDRSQRFIGSVAFSPDGQKYVYTTTTGASQQSSTAIARAVSAPGTFVYDTRTGAKVIAFPGSASAASFGAGGTEVAYAAIAGDLGHVYNFLTGLDQPLVGATAVLESISFNRAGTYVVTGGEDGRARVYDASSGNLLETLADGDTGGVLGASFGLDDTAIVTTSNDDQARLWTTPEPRPAAQLSLSVGLAPATDVGFTAADSRIVEAGEPGRGEVLDTRGLRVLARFAPPAGYRFAAAGASRDGRVLVGLAFRLSGHKLAGSVTETFDARTGRPLAKMTTPAGASLTGAYLNYAGNRLVTLYASGEAEQWDPRTGAPLQVLRASSPAVLASYSPDGSMLAVVHEPRLPAQVTVANGRTLGRVTIDLWSPHTGRFLRQITGPELTPLIQGVKQFAPLAVAFTANSNAIALAGANDEIEIWDTRTGAPTRALPVPGRQFAVSLGFSPSGKMLAAGTAAGAYVWNLQGPSLLPVFQHADPSQYALQQGAGVYVAFSRDSRILVTAGDLALEAWDVADHLQVFNAYATRGSLNAAGTKFVASAGDRLSIYPCDLCGGLSQLLVVAKRNVTRELTAAERQTYLGSH